MIAYPSNEKSVSPLCQTAAKTPRRTLHRTAAEKFRQIRNRLFAVVYFCGLLVFLLYLVLFPDKSGAAVRNSLAVCGKRLIPSLLPFLVVSRLAVSTGLSDSISDGIGGIFAKAAGLPQSAAAAFFMGAIGGFPVGAAMIGSLYGQKKLSREDAAFAAAVSDNAGLTFCVGGIGAAVFHRTAVGWQLYGCQIAADLLILTVCRRRRFTALPSISQNGTVPSKIDAASSKMPHLTKLSPARLLSLTADAVADSGLTMLKICAFAVVFAAAGEPIVASVSKVSRAAAAVFASVWELTLAGESVAAVLDAGQETVGKLLAAFAVGFGGVSVQTQIAAILSPSGISVKPCILLKFCQGLLSAVFMAIIVRLENL